METAIDGSVFIMSNLNGCNLQTGNSLICHFYFINMKTLLKVLRVFLSIFDQTLTAHFLKTGDAKINRIRTLDTESSR